VSEEIVATPDINLRLDETHKSVPSPFDKATGVCPRPRRLDGWSLRQMGRPGDPTATIRVRRNADHESTKHFSNKSEYDSKQKMSVKK